MQILDHRQIQQKIKRMATEILENNLGAKDLYFVGINNNGYLLAKCLVDQIGNITDKPIHLSRIKISPANPLETEISYDGDIKSLKSKTVILVDDVANTGRTMFFAFKPFLTILPKRFETAVLIDRTHKYFPVKSDYVGLALATTLKENILVNFDDKDNVFATLE